MTSTTPTTDDTGFVDGALHALATLNAGTDSFVQAQSGMTSAHHSLINRTKKHKENVL